jgi:hypothetical protein
VELARRRGGNDYGLTFTRFDRRELVREHRDGIGHLAEVLLVCLKGMKRTRLTSTGIVRAPVFTTAMQVASRVILVWGIVNEFPAETSTSVAYSTMLLAWSATEVVRYSYFVFFLNGAVPGVLQWLRYNGFFLLYPMGIGSEMWLVYKSVKPAGKRDERLPWLLWGVLGLYVPGKLSVPFIWCHMRAARS